MVTCRVKTERAKLQAKQNKVTPMIKAPAKLSSAKLSKLPALEKELTLSGPSKKQPLPSVGTR